MRKTERETSGMARNMRDRDMTYATTANNANDFAPRILLAIFEKNSLLKNIGTKTSDT